MKLYIEVDLPGLTPNDFSFTGRMDDPEVLHDLFYGLDDGQIAGDLRVRVVPDERINR